jgi:ribulose 1,5-bisphosphate carboxylase large subunit-like protein
VVGAGDAAGPVGVAVAFDFDFVGVLVTGFGGGAPRQSGGAGADAEAVRQVLEAHRRGLEGLQGKGPFVCSGEWFGGLVSP